MCSAEYSAPEAVGLGAHLVPISIMSPAAPWRGFRRWRSAAGDMVRVPVHVATAHEGAVRRVLRSALRDDRAVRALAHDQEIYGSLTIPGIGLVVVHLAAPIIGTIQEDRP